MYRILFLNLKNAQFCILLLRYEILIRSQNPSIVDKLLSNWVSNWQILSRNGTKILNSAIVLTFNIIDNYWFEKTEVPFWAWQTFIELLYSSRNCHFLSDLLSRRSGVSSSFYSSASIYLRSRLSRQYFDRGPHPHQGMPMLSRNLFAQSHLYRFIH